MEVTVSIIMPAYNVEKYIGSTLESVKNQTFKSWECIIVDDCSDDSTEKIVKEYSEQDKKFQYIKLDKNSGAATARNTAIKKATGKYLAFLDSDDIWAAEKLEKQVDFMERNHYVFTCTDYGKIDMYGNIQRRVVKAQKEYDYDKILKNCPGNSTIIYNCEKLGKIYADDIKRRNDFVMWLKVIKTAHKAYGLQEILAYHRERSDSISYKKATLLKYQWKVYRQIEKLSFGKSIYLLLYKVLSGVFIKISRLKD